MPPYTSYKQSDVSRSWLDNLLETDTYKNLFRQGLKKTEIEGRKVVKKEVEKAEKELRKEAKSSFDPLTLAFAAINPILAATYSGTRAYSKSKKMSALSQRLKKNLSDKFGNAGFLTDLYEGTGMEKALKGMKTSTLDDLLTGGISGATSMIFSKIFGDLGDKIVKPGTISSQATAGEVIKKPLESGIGIKAPDLLKPGALKPSTGGVGFQMPKMDFTVGQAPTIPIKPGGIGIKPTNMFDFTPPKMETVVAPGYGQQLKEHYKPSEIKKRAKNIYEDIGEKEWIEKLLKYLGGGK